MKKNAHLKLVSRSEKEGINQQALSPFRQNVLEALHFFYLVYGYTSITIGQLFDLISLKAQSEHQVRKSLLEFEDSGYLTIVYNETSNREDRLKLLKFPKELIDRYDLTQRQKEFLKSVHRIQSNQNFAANHAEISARLRMSERQKEFIEALQSLEQLGLIKQIEVSRESFCYLPYSSQRPKIKKR